jgi:hypothetical protein
VNMAWTMMNVYGYGVDAINELSPKWLRTIFVFCCIVWPLWCLGDM